MSTAYIIMSSHIISPPFLFIIGEICYNGKEKAGEKMAITYNKLWHMLIDRGMSKTDLQRAIKCSSNTIGKMTRNETISMKNLIEICELLDCQISDIVTIEKD